MRLFFLCALLFGIWLLLSGFLTPLFIALGLGSAILSGLLARRMDAMSDDVYRYYFSWQGLCYYTWLIREVITSSLRVTRLIWHPDLPISPTLGWVPYSQENREGVALYSNSITLTPGTVSIIIEDNQMQVHALEEDGLKDLQKGEMDRRVHEVTQKKKGS